MLVFGKKIETIFQDLASYSEWGYLYTQALLSNVTERAPNKRLSRLFSELLETEAIERGRDVTKYSVYMMGARNHPRAIQAMQSMLSRRQLNTADINVVSVQCLQLHFFRFLCSYKAQMAFPVLQFYISLVYRLSIT